MYKQYTFTKYLQNDSPTHILIGRVVELGGITEFHLFCGGITIVYYYYAWVVFWWYQTIKYNIVFSK